MSVYQLKLSIIIPIGSSEEAWETLLPQLSAITVSNEVILAASIEDTRSDEYFRSTADREVTICRSSQSRSMQMNLAAELSRGDILWFVHADSELTSSLVERLNSGLNELFHGLYYFNLRYQNDGPLLCSLNAWAANLRSQMFGIPFGDQGFLIYRELFFKIGGYPINCKYGEDHLFVWKVRRAGYPVCSLRASLVSSARKYKEGGWLSVTLNHSRLFLSQLVSQYLERMRL